MTCEDSRINIHTIKRMEEISADEWNSLSGSLPFQSYRWYQYGEQAMQDCPAIHLLAREDGALAARASLWLVRNEPLPKMNTILREIFALLLRYFPLLICRSPLVFTHGMVVANDADYKKFADVFSNAASEVAAKQKASFIVFDYLSKLNAQQFAGALFTSSAPNAGTIMENRWRDFDEYLASGNKKDRQHYKRTLREAERLGIRITRHSRAERIEEALDLIRLVERNHDTQFNPWARAMLENMEMVNAIFLTADIDGKMVGCGLLLEDNATQVTSLLGLAEDVPYAYFMLMYESLKVALEHQVRWLRWGSGAYEVKQRLGFSIEDNGAFAFTAVHPLVRKLIRRLV